MFECVLVRKHRRATHLLCTVSYGVYFHLSNPAPPCLHMSILNSGNGHRLRSERAKLAGFRSSLFKGPEIPIASLKVHEAGRKRGKQKEEREGV